MSTPSTISKEQVEHLAHLAQLALTPAEVEKFATQLTGILQYVDRVKEVEISDEVKRDFRKTNVFREDTDAFEAGEERDTILAAMPKVQDDMLVVQKILNN
jgi:aspartyl-tRNA(Asn)/glutamyl-tRNA(Gln) amidotransferase subunit C